MIETAIPSLGECAIRSPLARAGQEEVRFRTDADRVLWDDSLAAYHECAAQGREPITFEQAGPREKVFFNGSRATAAIVTCGGLCPGLNDVIRALVMALFHRYHVSTIYGFRYGYEGLIPSYGHIPMNLRPESVSNIHTLGGTILGSSRGPQSASDMVDTLEEMGIDLFFVVGGDGTLRGAGDLTLEIRNRGLRKAVVGIPKTIDNDIMFLDKSFGFESAFAEAVNALDCAHTEAIGVMNGIGLVKLMGRDSGFIAAFASLACNEVNFVLVPEVPFELHGARGLLEALRYRVAQRKHAVIVVAEGAGQHLMDSTGTDASGNKKMGDIGLLLKDSITEFFKERNTAVTLKYIDPSYTIRSIPASPQDNVYCSRLAQNAVHAAMAGKTGMVVGRWHGTFVHLPIALVTQGRRKLDAKSELWHSVLESTGQPTQLY